MKPLRAVLDKIEPLFLGDGPLAKLHPVFDAADTFMFDPNESAPAAPHVRDAINLKRYMITVVLCLMPPTMMAIYNGGMRALAVIMVSYTVGGIIEAIFSVARNEPISEGFLVTGLLYPLTLPVTTPLWMVGLGIAFGVIFGKEVFGGTGHNPFNPALVSRCFVLIAYPVDISPDKWVAPGSGIFGNALSYLHFGVNEDGRRAIFDLFDRIDGPAAVDAISGATALGMASVGGWELVQQNYSVFDLFIGHVPGSLGEAAAWASILGGIALCGMKVGNYRIPVSMVGTVAVFSSILYFFVNPLLGDVPSVDQFEPPWFHLFVGGLMFGAVYMATDPVSSPKTDRGRWVYGVVIGICAVLIRELTGYPEGVMFSILLGNTFAPLLDEMMFSRVRAKEAALVAS